MSNLGVTNLKLSTLLEEALKDLGICLASSEYILDLDYWHTPVNGKCRICLAGAMMSRILALGPQYALGLSAFAPEDRLLFQAINQTRLGDVDNALQTLGFERLGGVLDQPLYGLGDEVQLQFVRNVIPKLKERGL